MSVGCKVCITYGYTACNAMVQRSRVGDAAADDRSERFQWFAEDRVFGTELALFSFAFVGSGRSQPVRLIGRRNQFFSDAHILEVTASAILVGPLGQPEEHLMRNILLLGTMLTAFGIGTAMARSRSPISLDVDLAAAIATNSGSVESNTATLEDRSGSANITGGSFYNAHGIGQTNQNAGMNAALQNSLAGSYVHSAGNTVEPLGREHWLAASWNSGEVEHNHVISDGSSQSADIDNSYNATLGVYQLNQNSGANSLLQNSAAVAVEFGSTVSGDDLALSVAAAGNSGSVNRNCASSEEGEGSNTATINNSFSNGTGILQASHNVGANSLLQNSVAIGAVVKTSPF